MTAANLAHVQELADDLGTAIGHAERSLALYREIGNAQGQVIALVNLASLSGRTGDHRRERRFIEQGLMLAEEHRFGYGTAWLRLRSGVAHGRRGDVDAASPICGSASSR